MSRALYLSGWLLLGACRIGFDAQPTLEDAQGVDGLAASGDGAKGDSKLPVSCKSSYTFVYGTSKYRGGGSDTWTSFEADCESDGTGMHLAVIDDAAELAGLKALAGNTQTWIGISDRVTEGTFLTVTGATPPFLVWAGGSPMANGPDCVLWDPVSDTFSDANCGTPHPRICECDGVPASAGAY